MEESICKVKLVYGTPLIGRVEVTDKTFQVEIVVAGVEDGLIDVSIKDGELIVELEGDKRYAKEFCVAFISDKIEFLPAEITKENGVLYITAELKAPKYNSERILKV